MVRSAASTENTDRPGNAGNAGQESEQDLHLRAAANFINNGRYQEAMNVLNGINEHTARWYYYSAIANSGLGNNATALQHAKEALRMEPANYQYQMLVNQFESGGSWYRNARIRIHPPSAAEATGV